MSVRGNEARQVVVEVLVSLDGGWDEVLRFVENVAKDYGVEVFPVISYEGLEVSFLVVWWNY